MGISFSKSDARAEMIEAEIVTRIKKGKEGSKRSKEKIILTTQDVDKAEEFSKKEIKTLSKIIAKNIQVIEKQTRQAKKITSFLPSSNPERTLSLFLQINALIFLEAILKTPSTLDNISTFFKENQLVSFSEETPAQIIAEALFVFSRNGFSAQRKADKLFGDIALFSTETEEKETILSVATNLIEEAKKKQQQREECRKYLQAPYEESAPTGAMLALLDLDEEENITLSDIIKALCHAICKDQIEDLKKAAIEPLAEALAKSLGLTVLEVSPEKIEEVIAELKHEIEALTEENTFLRNEISHLKTEIELSFSVSSLLSETDSVVSSKDEEASFSESAETENIEMDFYFLEEEEGAIIVQNAPLIFSSPAESQKPQNASFEGEKSLSSLTKA